MEFTPSSVDFKWLRESGMYDEKMLDEIEKNQTFESLKNPDMANKLRDEKIALPLLYACCRDNDHRLCEIYKYIGYEVQNNLKDIDLSRRILLNVESLDGIKKTPLARDEKLILECVTIRSEIVGHISDDLMKNGEFVGKLSEQGPAVVKEMVKKYPVETLIAENPSLANNPQFMAEAISKDVNAIKYADKEMLNNYDVFATSAKTNDQVASYMLEHIEEFGNEAIKGAKDGTTERVRIDTIDELKALLEKYGADGNRERQIRDQESQEREGFDLYRLKTLVQILKKDKKISLNENAFNIVLNSADLTKSDIERQLRENPELIISQEEFGALPTPDELRKILEKSQIEDKEAILERLEKYEKFYTMAKEHKSKEKEPKDKVEVPRETREERDERLRTVDTKSVATERFMKARKYIKEKETYRPKPEFLRGLLEESELKDDKEAIAWLKEYTKYYEQTKSNEQAQEKQQAKEQPNAESLVGAALILPNNTQGLDLLKSLGVVGKEEVALTPEQMEQQKADDLKSNEERETVVGKETQKRGIETLRAEKSEGKTGPGM